MGEPRNFMKYFFIFIATWQLSFALIISPEAAMTKSFKAQTVTKKAMILTKKEQQKVQNLAKVKLSSKLFRLYIAKKSEQTIGFGILLTQKVRSKSTAVLYMLTPDGNLKNIEIIAFNEPKEYLPSKRWIAQFKEKKTKEFVENSDLTMISGATLSANAIIKVANIARAIWKVKLNK